VAKGFEHLPEGAKWVLIHDGARPCVSRRLLEGAVRSAMRYGAVACGLPATLTVKAVDEQRRVRLTLERDQLWFVQTPQVFRRDWLSQALHQADHRLSDFPDDAAMVESAGFPVHMVPGEALNLKVTTKDDLILAEAILRKR
jgi:2-C-methyl-D-erythritol 4-phosphate cytidylyltransferase